MSMEISKMVVLIALGAFMLGTTTLLYSMNEKLSIISEKISSLGPSQNAVGKDDVGQAQDVLTGNKDEEPQSPKFIERKNVSAGDDPYIGDDNAPVLIVEFSDYQCPFCQRFWQQSLRTLKKEYIDTGKVKFVYKDFPLEQLHPMATRAAEAANCAGEQGKYWEYHDILFERQNEWENGGLTELKSYAEELGLNVSEFEECVLSAKYKKEIKDDYDEGTILGVRGTPTFFINGRMLVGAQPYYNIKQIIEEELAATS